LSADRPNRHLTVKEATTMVVVGADVHKRTHTFVAIDEVGRKLAHYPASSIPTESTTSPSSSNDATHSCEKGFR
jgi:hypothetical protein